jgi:hypothetical protein
VGFEPLRLQSAHYKQFTLAPSRAGNQNMHHNRTYYNIFWCKSRHHENKAVILQEKAEEEAEALYILRLQQ